MSKNYGTRRIVVRAHYGLMDWLSQRVAAAIVASFTIVLLAQVLMPGAIGYSRWTGIFSARWMKVPTLIVAVSLMWHAWVGIRDIWMDYVKPVGLRLMLQMFSIVWPIGCTSWAVQLLWRL